MTTGETVETTGVNFAGRHRIYSNFSIACSVGYQHSDYYADGLSAEVRTDNYIFVRPSLAYDFGDWSQIELAYEYHRTCRPCCLLTLRKIWRVLSSTSYSNAG